MKQLNEHLAYLASMVSGKTGRILIMILTLGLFILSASAPNATIGIGK